jgi:hypothetical protein
MKKVKKYLYLENPDLFKQIHPTKNKNINLFKITTGSKKKIWWICEKGHEWDARINSVCWSGSWCGYCAGQKVCIDNCLATINPELAKEWHPTKNEELTPYDVVSGSGKKVWWKCEKGHEWKTSIAHRRGGTGCKKCVCHGSSEIERKFFYYLQTIFTDSINGYNINDTGNKIEIDIYIKSINLAIEYDGKFYHQEKSIIERDNFKNNFFKENNISLIRIREFGLPKMNESDIIYKYKDKKCFKITLISILDYILLNFDLDKNHKQKIEKIKNFDFENHVIPKGFFVYPIKTDSLLIKNPILSQEWHPTLNGDLKPEHVSCGSDKKVWWTCKEGHVWSASVYSRNFGHNCIECYKIYKQIKQNNKPVKRINNETGICIDIFISAKEAMNQTGVERRAIGRVCRGKLKSAGGYKWEFVK